MAKDGFANCWMRSWRLTAIIVFASYNVTLHIGGMLSMNTKDRSIVRDFSLAPEGRLKIDWVNAHMPVLNKIREQFEQEKPFQGLKVAISLHLEAKTAYLAKVVQAGGAEVAICGSNPLSTQDDVCAALVE